MCLLWKSLLVFVTWHGKVVCRRQQQRFKTWIDFYFIGPAASIMNLTEHKKPCRTPYRSQSAKPTFPFGIC